MPWFKVDDGFHGHPKVVELSLAAVGIWTLSGSWCADYLTDGVVSNKAITRMGGDDSLAAELVAAGLWLEAPDGYEFKDWAHYQPLKADVEAERAAAQERMRTIRSKRKGVRPNDTRTDDERSPEQSENIGRSSENVRSTPSQSHPSPPPIPNKRESTAKRGTRLSPDWTPSVDSIAKIRTDAPDVNAQLEHATFVDYWIAQPGQKGVKTDWEATWRNWMRRKQGDLGSRGGAPRSSSPPSGRPSKAERARSVIEQGIRAQEAADRKGIAS